LTGVTALSLTAFYRLPPQNVRMIDKFADGSWLTPQRMRLAAILSGAATVLVLGYLFATASGTVDHLGRPLGTDFSNVWTAGRMVLNDRAAEAWEWGAHYRVQQQVHGNDVPFYGWHYPPPFLLLASLLALLPYVPALLLWQATTLAAVLLLLRKVLPGRRAMVFGLAAPVVLVCLSHGHNGFLTAALLGSGLLLLDRRPVVAGLLLGCLVYKPQFAIVIPPLLLVACNWRAIAGAALSAGVLTGATLLLWGLPVWQAFIDSLPLTREVVMESGATGWHKIQSPFAMIRMWGGDLPASYAAQMLATGTALAVTLWLTKKAQPTQRNAAAIATALISTPYVLDYDFVPLGIALAFLVADGLRRGFLSYEKSLYALVWLAPLFARQLAEVALLPLGQATAVIVLILAARRAAVLDGATLPPLRSWPSRHSRESLGR